MRTGLVMFLCLISLLAGCDRSDGGETRRQWRTIHFLRLPATPATAPAAAHVGASGGTVTEVSGASVIVPAGALTTDTTIRVAMDHGAPALPAGLTGQGNTYVITPHGGNFAQPVQVRIPAPAVTLQPNQELKLAKVQPGEPWEVLAGTTLTDGVLSAEVNSFSFFRAVGRHVPVRARGNASSPGDRSDPGLRPTSLQPCV